MTHDSTGAGATAHDVAGDFETLRHAYPFGSVATFDEDFRYLSVAGRGWAALGIDPRDLEGRPMDDVWDRSTADRLRELAHTALSGAEAMARIPYEGGVFEVWAGPLPSREEGCRGMFLSRDVSAEVDHRRRAAFLEQALDASDLGVTLVDLEGDDEPLIYVSAGFERLTGYAASDSLGRNCRLLQGEGTDDTETARIRAAIDAREPYQGTILNYRKDGISFWNRLTLSPVPGPDGRIQHYVGIQEDVTEIREAEVERDHQRRLAEVGTLASGAAHDFNNILMEIEGRLAIGRQMADIEATRSELEEISAVVRRGATLVQQLLAYGRRQQPAQGATARSSSIRDFTSALVRVLPKSVAVHTSVPEEELPVAIGESELERILLNLTTNAADAMPDGGNLWIDVEPVSQEMIRLSIADDGTGMSDEVMAKAFDRFFTTKGAAGTGLGLSSVRQITERAGGAVSVSRREGGGTVFTVLLPRATSHAAETPDRAGHREPTRRHEGLEGLHVLLAEDEHGIRRVLERLLRREGMRVVPAVDGVEALAAFQQSREGFDVILADRDMPRLTGDRLLTTIAAEISEDAEPPLLCLMSGDLPDPANIPTDTLVIAKPFEVGELIRQLEGALVV